MAKILFLAHRAPFPPNKGDKIRAFHVLQHLAANHDVWLGAGVDETADLQHLPLAKQLCRDAYFGWLGPIRRTANMALGALTGSPISVSRFHHGGLARWVRRILTEVKPDFAYVFSSAPAQFLFDVGVNRPRVIIDFVDADAEKWRAYAQSTPRPQRWIFGEEFKRLVGFDRQALAMAEAGLLISHTERSLFAEFAPEGAGKLHVMANGVDTEFFRPMDGASSGRNIVMCGRMDYRPNVEGAVWFAREILPLVRAQAPDAVLRIVGAMPAPQVGALAEPGRIEVTGAVSDVRPYLADAAVVIAPLLIARGIQNKVLEGMAAGRPMVATPDALDGISAQPGRDILVGADAAQFAEKVSDVLLNRAPPNLGANGRRHVLDHYQWAHQLKVLDKIMLETPHRSSGQAAA